MLNSKQKIGLITPDFVNWGSVFERTEQIKFEMNKISAKYYAFGHILKCTFIIDQESDEKWRKIGPGQLILASMMIVFPIFEQK